MLKRLEITNYAIIEQIDIDFSDKLTIITGETGAGKSIIMGALHLLLGKRADRNTLFDADKKCVIEGSFQIDGYDLEPWFSEHELEYENPLILRREISKSGKSRAFINDGLTTLNVLQELSIYLIDIYAQFDNLDLHHQEEQFKILDTLAGQLDQVKLYQTQYDQLSKKRNELRTLQEQLRQEIKEQDYIQFQFDEIEKLQIKSGEYQELEQLQARMAQATDIQTLCNQAVELLQEGTPSVQQLLLKIVHEFRGLKSEIPEIQNIIERMDSTALEIEDITSEISNLGEADYETEYSLEEIEDRLSDIHNLLRKHQLQDGDELLELAIQLSNQLSAQVELDDRITALISDIESQEKTLFNQASNISKGRQRIKSSLEKTIQDLLDKLAMPHAQLVVELTSQKQLNRWGCDQVELLFTANLGKAPQPLNKVASGGEMSRLNLCLKSVVAGQSTLPTLIFDEIDTGISGMVAEKMGQMIHDLAQHHQIISITHSPQIAAKANHHYFVYKKGSTGKTTTHVKLLSEEERITEIAIMLSTNPPSASALANAKELLNL